MRRDFTLQDMELSRLHSLLSKNIKDPNSVFQKLVNHSPQALDHLLDRCLIHQGTKNRMGGRIYLDLFLFKSSTKVWASELSMSNLLFSQGKNHLFDHALFQLLIQMKWMKVRYFFLFGLLNHFIYMFVALGFSIINFSNAFDKEESGYQKIYWWYAFAIFNSNVMFAEILQFCHFILKFAHQRKRIKYSSYCDKVALMYELVYILCGSITPILGFGVLYYMNRYVMACLVLYVGWYFLLTIPTMTSQVIRTIFGLVLAYSPQIISFAVAFHLLLPESSVFG